MTGWVRRALAVLTAVVIAALGLPAVAHATTTSWYAAAAARGDGSGTSRDNATFWRNVNTLPLAPGDTVNFLTDTPYRVFIRGGPGLALTQAGTISAPIVFRGVGATDTTPACATFTSNRPDPYMPPSPDGTGTVGSNVFALQPGANNLRFESVCAHNVNTMFVVATRMQNMDAQGRPVVNTTSVGADGLTVIDQEQPHPLQLSGITLTGGRRLLDVQPGGGVVNGRFDNLTVNGFSKTALRFNASSNNLIQDINFDGQGQTNDYFQVGVMFAGNTADTANHDNLIRRATIRDTFQDTGATSYSQGDAVSDEEYDTGTRVESSNFYDGGDAGFDAKGADAAATDTTVTGSKWGFRSHGHTLTLTRVTVTNPVKRAGAFSFGHLQATATINAAASTFTGPDPGLTAFLAETVPATAGNITLTGSNLTLSTQATVTRAAPGAQVNLNDTVIVRQ